MSNKRQFLACSVLTKLTDANDPSQKILIGFEKIHEFGADGPSTRCKIIRINDFELYEEGLSKSFEVCKDFAATSLKNIPARAKLALQDVIDDLSEIGFELGVAYQDAVLEADGSLQGVIDTSVQDSAPEYHSIGWYFEPGDNYCEKRMANALDEVRNTLGLGVVNGTQLAFENYSILEPKEPIPALNELKVVGHGGGAGELLQSHGITPLLALICLNRLLDVGDGNFMFSNHLGDELVLSRYSDLKEHFTQYFGFEETEVRKVAVQLGLAAEIIDLSKTKTDLENYFF